MPNDYKYVEVRRFRKTGRAELSVGIAGARKVAATCDLADADFRAADLEIGFSFGLDEGIKLQHALDDLPTKRSCNVE